MTTTASLAITIAERAHAGRTYKAGRPYMEHVLAVVAGVETDEEKIVAALHDVLEDCPDWTPERLIGEGIPADLVSSVLVLTKRSGESYSDFVERVKADPIARRVKIADLTHNMDLSRLPAVSDADRDRLEKYRRALSALAT
jgi:(p)ppGpp synthase/HD superfamily hydrolase